MNECLFWGKFWFENCTLLQKGHFRSEKGHFRPEGVLQKNVSNTIVLPEASARPGLEAAIFTARNWLPPALQFSKARRILLAETAGQYCPECLKYMLTLDHFN
jgi:hypothetical protein